MGDQVSGSGESSVPYRYWAFISHSSHDKAVAKWLHRSIEQYGIPAQLLSHKLPTGERAPRRFFPLFYDRAELPAAHALDEQLKLALHESRYLIVVCSPAAAQSKYVNWEIEEFRRLGRDRRILALIVDGEPSCGDARECFPPELLKVEPLAADLRQHADGPRLAIIKLLAGMLGVRADELILRDRQRRQRRLAIATLTVSVLLVVFAFMVVQNRLAEQERLLALAEMEVSQAVAEAERERSRAAKASEAEAIALAAREQALTQEQRARAELALKKVEEEEQRAEVERLRAESEKQRAELATQKAREQEERAELESQRAETERIRAETEKERAEVERMRAEEEERRADEEKRQADVARRLRVLREYAADMREAQRRWEAKEVGEMGELLDKYASPGALDPRGFEWHYLRKTRAGTSKLEFRIPTAGGGRAADSFNTSADRDGMMPSSDWRSLAFDPVRKRIAGISNWNGSVFVWELEEGAEPKSAGSAMDLVYTADGAHLVTLDLDRRTGTYGTVTVRDGDRLEVLGEWQTGNGLFHRMAIQQGGNLLVTSSGASVSTWEVPSGKRLGSLVSEGNVTALALSPDGVFLAAGTDDGRVYIQEMANRQVTQRTDDSQGGMIIGLSFSPDGEKLAIHSAGSFMMAIGTFMPGNIKVWDHQRNVVQSTVVPNLWRILKMPLLAGESLRIPNGKYDPIFHPDGTRLFTNGPKSVQIWDISTGERLDEMIGNDSLVTALALNSGGTFAAGAGSGGRLLVWPLEEERLDSTVASFYAGIGPLIVSGDSKILHGLGEAVSQSHGESGSGLRRTGDYTAITWDLSKGGLAPMISGGGQLGVALSDHTLNVKSKSGKLTASGDGEGNVTLIEGGIENSTRAWPTHRGAVLVIALSPDEKYLVSGGIDRRLCVRDVATGELVTSLPGHSREVGALTFTADSRRLASGSGQVTVGDNRSGEIIIWDTETWAPCLVLQEETPATYDGLAFTADGRCLYSSVNPVGGGVHPGRVRVWDAK